MQKNLDIAIIGGTFNPIHNGHMHAARTVLDIISPDIVLFMVSGIPPHKRVENERAMRAHRLNMTRLACEGEDRFEASDIELQNEDVSYTINTLSKLKKLYEPRKMSLILGTDMFLSFEKWKSYDKILDMSDLIVLPRFKNSLSDIEKKRDGEFYAWRDKITVIDAQILEISSTYLRTLAAKGESLRGLVPPAVEEYIEKNRIYV